MITFKTSVLKQIQAAAILVQLEGGTTDRIRLLKLLYVADRESLAERGLPIIGGRVVALDHGPVHSEMFDLIKGAHQDASTWSDHISNDGHLVVFECDPGRGELSPFEIEKLTAVSDAFRSMDSWAVAEKTREFAEWRECYMRGSAQMIPLERMLVVLGFTADEIGGIHRDAESKSRLARAFAQEYPQAVNIGPSGTAP